VRRGRNIGHRLVVRHPRQVELEHADRLPAVGHRREQAGAAGAAQHLDGLAHERAALRCPRQRHPLRGLTALRAHCRRAAGVVEPDERLAGEVGDEEGDAGCAERVGEALADDVGRVDRRRVLDGRQQLVEIQSRHRRAA
jgi:hypothetical protein